MTLNTRFSLLRLFSYTLREALELRRDPIRGSIALFGTVLLMFIMGYGISMDVENLRFAVLDRDQTTLSRNYILDLSGSRYFIEQPPITDYGELDQRMRSGELSLALEIPRISHVIWHAVITSESAPGSMAQCPHAPRIYLVMYRRCIKTGCSSRHAIMPQIIYLPG